MSTLVASRHESGGEAASILQEAAAFIWREAEILDRQDYDAWLPLWKKDGLYVIPIDREGGDRAAELNLLYDDDTMRRARIKRLKSGFSMSSAPAARTARTVSRFVLGAQEGDAIEVRCAQLLAEYKFDQTRLLAADCTYRLIRRPEGFLIERKEVLLLNSDDHLWGVGYLL